MEVVCLRVTKRVDVSNAQDKLSISCLHGGAVPELMRCLRSQISNLIAGKREPDIVCG